jgi:hypothetical protein
MSARPALRQLLARPVKPTPHALLSSAVPLARSTLVPFPARRLSPRFLASHWVWNSALAWAAVLSYALHEPRSSAVVGLSLWRYDGYGDEVGGACARVEGERSDGERVCGGPGVQA